MYTHGHGNFWLVVIKNIAVNCLSLPCFLEWGCYRRRKQTPWNTNAILISLSLINVTDHYYKYTNAEEVVHVHENEKWRNLISFHFILNYVFLFYQFFLSLTNRDYSLWWNQHDFHHYFHYVFLCVLLVHNVVIHLINSFYLLPISTFRFEFHGINIIFLSLSFFSALVSGRI